MKDLLNPVSEPLHLNKPEFKRGDKVRYIGEDRVYNNRVFTLLKRYSPNSSPFWTVFETSAGFLESELELVTVENTKTEVGLKYDTGKPDLSLVSKGLVEAAARALGYGASKYTRNNYKNGIELNRLYASLLRHLFARMEGEVLDNESGLDHLDHIAANVQMLIYMVESGKGQ